MKHLILAELYRMKNSKSPLILLLACFGLSLLNAATSGLMFGNAPWLISMYEEAFGFNPFEAALGSGAGPNVDSIRSLADFISASNGNIGIFLVFFIAIFLLPLRRNGFIKNIASEHSRSRVFGVHALLVLVYSFLLTDVSAIAVSLMSLAFFRNLPIGNVLDIAVYLVVSALISAAIGIVVLMLTDLTSRPISVIVMSLIYLWFVFPLVYSISSVGAMLRPNAGFRLLYISLPGNQVMLTAGKWDTVLSSLLVVLFYVGISVLLELTLLKRRDRI